MRNIKNLMNKIILLIILTTLINITGLNFVKVGTAQASIDLSDPIMELMNSLDLSKPEIKDIAPYVKTGKYDEAMEEYTEHFIKKVRKIDFGEFGWHEWYGGTIMSTTADIMVGNLTVEEFIDKHGKIYVWIDKYNIDGDDENKIINWTPDNDNGHNYGDFKAFVPITSAFNNTGNKIYLDKWFYIASDFCLNQKRQIELKNADYLKDHEAGWTSEAGSALSQGTRVINIIKSLAVFAKIISENDRKIPWVDILKPISTDVQEDAIKLIPPKELAIIILSLINDHPDILINRYVNTGAVPNQRFNGLMALAMISRVFSEFNQAKAIEEQASLGIADFAKNMYYKDGVILEQSFNYNMGTNTEAERMLNLYDGEQNKPDFIDELNKNILNFNRMLKGLATPIGGLPGLAAYSAPNVPAIWQGKDILEKWKNSANIDESKKAFTSIAFPYGGYYIMRSGWDIVNDVYLSFINAKRARGHMSPNSNSIEVIAYGRKMLTYGGPPWYDISGAPDSQKDDYENINSYFQGGSSYKNNTVIVNVKSQDVTNKDGRVLQDTLVEPNVSRWVSTAKYDYVEGLWDGGYKDENNEKKLGVNHLRQVIFAKDAGLWIVNDTMINSTNSENGYSQIWGFVPKNEVNKIEGFTNEQVIIDKKDSYIMTQDKNGPNIWLYSFSPEQIDYKKYYGSKDESQYLGWYSMGINGENVPKVDVHVNWSNEKSMLTVIAPSKDSNSPIIDRKDLSKDDVSGFEVTTENGNKITYLASNTEKEFTIDNLNVKSKSILLNNEPGGKVSGIVLGCVSMKHGNKSIEAKLEDFQFELVGSELKNVTAITMPTDFQWKDTPEGIVPEYSGVAVKDVISSSFNLIGPKDRTKKVNPKDAIFTWEESERARYYKLTIAKDKDFKEIIRVSQTPETKIKIVTLDFNTTYHWKVEALNKQDISKVGNQVFSFSTEKTKAVREKITAIRNSIIYIMLAILIITITVLLIRKNRRSKVVVCE